MKWNFAYGSNLHPDRVRGRTGFEPRRCEPAILTDWRLAFNLATGMRWVEPAMANIVPAPNEMVHGVALEMDDEELALLVESEGGSFWYRAVPVEVETYGGERLIATAFVAHDEMVRDEVPPSTRYLRLLREGARHHGLAEGYCAFLDAHDAAVPNAASPWMGPFFRALEHPRARRARDAFVWMIQHLARAEARAAKRPGKGFSEP